MPAQRNLERGAQACFYPAQLLTSDHIVTTGGRHMRIRVVVAGLACCVALGQARAQNLGPTLQKIKDSGTIDIECGSTTNNLERQRQVGFSNTLFIVGTRLLTKKDSGLKDFPDLTGKNVVTTAGTTSERLLRKLNEDKAMKMNVISAKDHGESFLTLESGRAVAFMMDDALLAGEVAKARRAGDWVITGTPQSREAYGCMLRK